MRDDGRDVGSPAGTTEERVIVCAGGPVWTTESSPARERWVEGLIEVTKPREGRQKRPSAVRTGTRAATFCVAIVLLIVAHRYPCAPLGRPRYGVPASAGWT